MYKNRMCYCNKSKYGDNTDLCECHHKINPHFKVIRKNKFDAIGVIQMSVHWEIGLNRRCCKFLVALCTAEMQPRRK
jgi:hypothetical protein